MNDRLNLWVLGCLLLRFLVSDTLCEDLLPRLPALRTGSVSVVEEFDAINAMVVSLERRLPPGTSALSLCLVLMYSQGSLYFPISDVGIY